MFIGAVVAVLFAACASWFQRQPTNPEPDITVACKALVRERLKAPASADFSHVTMSGSGPEYTVRGFVDSENGFGARLRSSFTCEATWNEASETATNLTVDVG